MNEDIEYDVIKEEELYRLISVVNVKLKNGWFLVGGIGVGQAFYYQAIAKINFKEK
jgi:hypothetical protein